MHENCIVRLATLFTFMLCAPASADNINWSGFYLGGHVGALTGTTSFANPYGPSLFGDDVTTPGFMAGVQLGYNWLVAPQWLIGLQVDGSYLSAQGSNTCLQASITTIGSNCKAAPRELATLTGRLGHVIDPQGRTLLYGKAGAAWMHTEVSLNPGNAFRNLSDGVVLASEPTQGNPTTRSLSALGWTVGAGVEYALTTAWSLSLEYDYLRFSGLGAPAPATANVATNGAVSNIAGGAHSSITQDLHMLKVGLNYRWGGASSRESSTNGAAQVAPPWAAGWEVEVGARYWHSSGRNQLLNSISPNVLQSRLTYDGLEGHTAEVFGRIDSPFDVFVKGLFGGGYIAGGRFHDEDWGLSDGVPASYEVTRSEVTGTLNYFTVDIGYNVMRGRDHKVGFFVGYNRYQQVVDAFGCTQLVNPGSGICSPANTPDTKIISELDTWHSLRVGTSVEVGIWDRFRIGADLAYLPYVSLEGLDIHHLRNDYFPIQGRGQGVQVELILSYRATDALSFGVGGRYWAMWTTTGHQTTDPSTLLNISNERYGVFVQAAYRFMPN